MLRCWRINVREQQLKNGFIEGESSMRNRAIEEYNKQYNWPVVSILEEFNNQVKNPSVTIIPVSVIEEWHEDVLELTVYYNVT